MRKSTGKPVGTPAVSFSLHQNDNKLLLKYPYLVRRRIRPLISPVCTKRSYLDIPRTSIGCPTNICECPANLPNIPDVRPMNIYGYLGIHEL